MKIKSNKGMAMAYTLVAMIIIFAACLLITTVALVRVAYSRSFAETSELYRAAQQIGEIFCESDEQTFADALNAAGFETTQNSITYDGLEFSYVVSGDTLDIGIDDKTALHVVKSESGIEQWILGEID